MSDHLTQTQIENYGRNPLSAMKSLSISDHLADCEACRQRLEDALNDDEEYLDLKAELLADAEALSSKRDHLTFEEMAEMVDGTLTGEELQIAKDHLSCCENCDRAIKDLAAFKDKVVPGFERERRPSALQTSAGSRWRRLSAVLLLLRPKSPAFVFVPALAALLLAVSGWLLWHERSENALKPEIATATPTPGVAPSNSPDHAESPVLSQLNDGEGLLAMDRDGHLRGAEYLPPAYRQMIERALATQEIERSPLLSEMTRPEDASRGRSGRKEEFSVIGPAGEVTLSDRPTFRWSPLDGATGYVVEVFDEKLNLAVVSPQIADRSWTASQPLRRGDIYFWEVKAIKDGRTVVAPAPPAQSAKFRVLDQARAGELLRARRAYGSSRLTMGLLYARAGLLNEAERELRELQKANPDSEVAGRLLSRIQGMRKTQRL